MYLFITILILIVSVFLVLIVLVQNSKGGGLSSGFSSSNQIMGAPKTADFLEKATWSLAGALIVLSILAAVFLPRNIVVDQSELNGQIKTETAAPGFDIMDNQEATQEAPAQEGESAPQESETPAK
ncbi:MAG: preprotein translocase subunit SecG [Bacteroidales bacterium]|nr:preprotein translocase subunit SecG [Bacteroidales bacterium]